MGPERAAEAVEAVRNDLMTSRAVGAPQGRVSGSASIADRVGPSPLPAIPDKK